MRTVTLSVIVLLGPLGGPALAQSWTVESPHKTPLFTNVGAKSDLALDSAGNAYIVYDDTTGGNLRLAWKPQGSWVDEVVSAVSHDGSIAVASNGDLHVTCLRGAYPDTFTVKHFVKSGGAWTADSISTPGGDPHNRAPIVVDAADVPHVAVNDVPMWPGDIYYASPAAGGGWSLDFVEGNTWAFMDLALDPYGEPHIVVYNAGGPDVKYAFRSGGTWTVETILADIGWMPSIAVDPFGVPHVSWVSRNLETIRYACRAGGTWTSEIAHGVSNTDYRSSIAVDAFGVPTIAYYNGVADELGLATKANWTWAIDTVPHPQGNDAGLHPSIALDSYGSPVVSYWDRTDTDLLLARFHPPSVTVFGTEHKGAGQATLVNVSGELWMGNLGTTGHDGVRFWPAGPPRSLGMTIGPLGAASSTTDGAVLRFQGVAYPPDPSIQSGPSFPPCPTRLTDVGAHVELSVGDGTGTSTVEVYDGGQVVATVPGASSPLATFPEWPIALGLAWETDASARTAQPMRRAVHAVKLDASHPLFVQGIPYTGDSLRVVADTPTPSLGWFDVGELTAASLGTIRIQDESFPTAVSAPIASTGGAAAAGNIRIVPNPAPGGHTEMRWVGPARAAPRELAIFDVTGRRVRALSRLRGRTRSAWDGRNDAGAAVAPGTYFVRWRSDESSGAARLTVLR